MDQVADSIIQTMVATTYQQRLNEAMDEAKVGTAALAAALGVSYQAISKAREGRTKSLTAANNDAAAAFLGVSAGWLATGNGPKRATATHEHLEPAGEPRTVRQVPVVGTARLGDNGYYDELQHPAGHGDGTIDSYSADRNAYALRVRGDSMHPAIRHGSFVVVEPNGTCVPGEYVVIALTDGRKMVKELVIERAAEIVVESVNGNHRITIDRSEIERMHPVAAVVAASKWRPA